MFFLPLNIVFFLTLHAQFIIEIMTIEEAIKQRHSVRKYIHKPLSTEVVRALEEKILECNKEGGLHIQLVTQETKAFSGIMSYGKFHGVENYLVMAGQKDDNLDERIGYYGEQLVLLAQALGLNTCWAGLSYRKVNEAYKIEEGEKLTCMIALGYGESQGVSHKIKTMEQVSNATRILLHGSERAWKQLFLLRQPSISRSSHSSCKTRKIQKLVVNPKFLPREASQW